MRIYVDGLSRVPTVSIGTQAFLIASMQIVKKYVKNAEFVMLSAFSEIERTYCHSEPYKINLIKRGGTQFQTIKDIRFILRNVDAIISPWGDGYITTPPQKILNKMVFLKSHKKPTILFPSSIGPFDTKIKRYLSKKGLEKFDRLMARDTITYSFLKDMGLNNLYLVPDSAFLLEPCDESRLQDILANEQIPQKETFIGLNISQLLNVLYKEQLKVDYSQFMADTIDYLYASFGKKVLLVPHQVYPSVYNGIFTKDSLDGDDRYAIQETIKKLKNKEIAYPILGEYNPRDYKGLIGKCEIFIGGRMHSVIGAVSQGIPSLLIQYSHKASGVMNLIGLERYVWDYKSPKEIFTELISDIWNNRDTISSGLWQRMTNVKNEAWKAGEIFVDALKEFKLNF